MTVRGTGVLLGLLGALAGYLWVTAPDPAPPAGSQAPPLLAASPGAVARVELAEGERRVTALRAGDGWADAAGHSWPDGAVYARRTGEPAVLLVGAVLGWELDKLRRAAPGGDP